MSNLSVSINKSDDGKLLVMKCIGVIDPGMLLPKIIEAHALGRETGISKFLVDLTESRNAESTVTNYRFVNKNMAGPDIEKTAHVAFLVDPEDHSHDFLETVSINAGHNVRLFRDRTLAVQHLEQ